MAAICGHDLYKNGLHYEPMRGDLEAIFASSDGPVRILDLGQSYTSATFALSLSR